MDSLPAGWSAPRIILQHASSLVKGWVDGSRLRVAVGLAAALFLIPRGTASGGEV